MCIVRAPFLCRVAKRNWVKVGNRLLYFSLVAPRTWIASRARSVPWFEGFTMNSMLHCERRRADGKCLWNFLLFPECAVLMGCIVLWRRRRRRRRHYKCAYCSFFSVFKAQIVCSLLCLAAMVHCASDDCFSLTNSWTSNRAAFAWLWCFIPVVPTFFLSISFEHNIA